ncbi:MAG: hypothetical protein D6698_17610 [Gammaproteobacteria bacterium]|nr:MAG: hypothetical protein D6698_17610 [Gammaproteobacteria bacterium]
MDGTETLQEILKNLLKCALQLYGRTMPVVNPTTIRKWDPMPSMAEMEAAYIGDEYWSTILQTCNRYGNGCIWWQPPGSPVLPSALEIAETMMTD